MAAAGLDPAHLAVTAQYAATDHAARNHLGECVSDRISHVNASGYIWARQRVPAWPAELETACRRENTVLAKAGRSTT